MKKLIIILMLLIPFLSQSQVGLKGYNLKDHYNGEEIIDVTLANVPGVLVIGTINDGRIFSLSFIPSNDGENISRIYEQDLLLIKNGLEEKFDIKFQKEKEKYDDDFTWIRRFGSSLCFISVEKNQFMEPPYKITVSLSDGELYDIHVKEEQEKANKDF